MIRLLVPVLCVAALGACGSKPPTPVSAEPGAGSGAGSATTAQPVAPPVEATPAIEAMPAPEATSGFETMPAIEVAPEATPAPETTKPSEPTKHPEPAKPDPAKAKANLLAAETRAWNAAKPVLEKYCAKCHSQGAQGATKKKLDRFDMSAYPMTGPHAATIGTTMRDVMGISGKKPTMPFGKPGAVTGDELAAIKAWTDAWQAADKAGAHKG